MACTPEVLQQVGQRGGRLAAPMNELVFPVLPHADTGAVQVLLRTLAGLEDFARVTAHHTRRDLHPALATDDFKHCCLSCLVYRSERVLDSEWHSFCECPGTASARSRFSEICTTELTYNQPCTAKDLCRLVAHVSSDPRKAGALATLALNVRATRRHTFRKLSTHGPTGRGLVAVQLTQLQNLGAAPAVI